MKDFFLTGTRPDIIKLAPLILKLKPIVCHSGQHLELAKEAFDVFRIAPDIDLGLMTENQEPLKFIIECCDRLRRVIEEEKPDRIWVHGDTMTAFAGALIAMATKIKCVHVEAGLRTGDFLNPYPEEAFRFFIDQMADYLFAPTERSVKNLKEERVKGKIFLVGNTIVDALEIIKPRLPDFSPEEEPYVLATIHRRESFGKDMEEIFYAIKKLSREIRVILPLHPNPNVREIAKRVEIDFTRPMDYKTFLWYLKFCKYIISDAGGIQEEAPSFQKKVAVIRKKTERPEVMESGCGILIDKMDRNFIYQRIKTLEQMKVEWGKNPFGNGLASSKILSIIKNITGK